jgi:hypothetical protein
MDAALSKIMSRVLSKATLLLKAHSSKTLKQKDSDDELSEYLEKLYKTRVKEPIPTNIANVTEKQQEPDIFLGQAAASDDEMTNITSDSNDLAETRSVATERFGKIKSIQDLMQQEPIIEDIESFDDSLSHNDSIAEDIQLDLNEDQVEATQVEPAIEQVIQADQPTRAEVGQVTQAEVTQPAAKMESVTNEPIRGHESVTNGSIENNETKDVKIDLNLDLLNQITKSHLLLLQQLLVNQQSTTIQEEWYIPTTLQETRNYPRQGTTLQETRNYPRQGTTLQETRNYPRQGRRTKK